ncbi:ABC transporter ATP-binding protein [Patescibacteria group bacterium]|nr:ABC transporter ATP-binding protein [Patescibacteria group bacterium]
MVHVQDLRKAYGNSGMSTEVLKGINLTIQSGEFVAIMGLSGSGKSTLMHILGLLDKPTSGVYELDGAKVDSLSENRLAELRNLKLGFVFQSFNLLARTSALENVELPLIYNNKFSANERRQVAEQALQSVGLSHRLKASPNQLSGGEQQRVAIARALVSNPQIIFADEPTGNLDTKTSIEIMGILKRLHQQGKTIILVTHETGIAKFAERIITIRDGLIVDDRFNQQTNENIN